MPKQTYGIYLRVSPHTYRNLREYAERERDENARPNITAAINFILDDFFAKRSSATEIEAPEMEDFLEGYSGGS